MNQTNVQTPASKFRNIFLDFERSPELPAIKELATLDHHDHSTDPHFPDPWDKHRRPKETIF